jgi:hypothetical protein
LKRGSRNKIFSFYFFFGGQDQCFLEMNFDIVEPKKKIGKFLEGFLEKI